MADNLSQHIQEISRWRDEGLSLRAIAGRLAEIGGPVVDPKTIAARLRKPVQSLEHISEQIRSLAVPIGTLHLDRRNARRHPENNLTAIKGSLQEFGQMKPIVANVRSGKPVVIAGNGTLEAALGLGWTHIAVITVNVSEATAAAFALADNRTAELAEWDAKTLAAILMELEQDDVDMSALGFDDEFVKGVLAEANPASDDPDPPGDDPAPIDKAAELQKVWQTARGQIWEIPSKTVPDRCHRVMCGDSTEEADVGTLLSGITAVMMETDPPYGIDYSALKNGIPGSGFAHHTEQHGDIENDGLTDGTALQAFLEKMIRAALPYMSATAAYYFWHPMLTQGTFFAAAAAADILIHRQIIWVKPGFVLTRSGMYHWKHELCFYGWVRGNKPPWYGDKSQTSVWDDFGRDADHGMHPTQKPIELFLRPMRNHVQRGEWVYEPFGGSGSQVLAAEYHGCLCAAMELSPKFAAVILERAKNAGLEPRLIQ